MCKAVLSYFIKYAIANAPGPAWVPTTLPMSVILGVVSHKELFSLTKFWSKVWSEPV